MKNLVQAFQDFDWDGGADNPDLEALVRKEFPIKYKVPAEEAVLSPTRNILTVPQREMLDELVQHLTDLDYLNLKFFEKYQASVHQVLPKAIAKKIIAALESYLKDDTTLQVSELDPEQLDLNELISGNDLFPIVLERLTLLTSLDGEMTTDVPLKIGDQNLWTRVLLYRFRALGQLFKNERVSDPLNELHIVRLWNFERWIGVRKPDSGEPPNDEKISPEQFALTGNAHALFQKFCETNRRQLLFYNCPNTGAEEDAKYEFLMVFHGRFYDGKNRRQFRRACNNRTVKVRGREIKPELNSALAVISERGTNEAAFKTLSNKFGIHLMQLKMWMYGFYFGRIDGQYGPLSHASFLDLLEHEKQDKKRKRQQILLALDEGYWAVNLPKAKELFKDFDQHLAKTKKREDEILSKVNADNEAPILEAQSRQRQVEVNSFFDHARMKGRRIYHGIKSAVACAFRGIGRVVKWLARKLKKVAGAVVSFLKNVFKRIREGVQVFYRAMRRFGIFILGKPLITPENFRKSPPNTPIAFSRFNLDFDIINFQSNSIGADLENEHMRTVRRLLYGLSLFLEIAALAIPLIRSLATMSWVQLGVQLGRLVVRLIRKHVDLPKMPAPVRLPLPAIA